MRRNHEEVAVKVSTSVRGFAAVVAALLVTAGAGSAQAADQTIEMAAARFEFRPARIEVTQGDHVTLKLHSVDSDHGLEIKEFKVKVLVPKGGAVVTAQFVATKAGTFRFTCSEYCGSGHSRMKGVLVVKPAGGTQ